jgi:starch-binding outer membrane protein, SusD/RagB family
MKYTKYLAILAAAFMMGSCSDDFLDKEPSENASEDQIKDLLDKDPTAIQAYITGYYKNMFSPEAQQSHDDFGLKAFELATDLMGDDMAYMTSHFFSTLSSPLSACSFRPLITSFAPLITAYNSCQ